VLRLAVSRKGSAMVLSDRVLATSYRLSIVTMSQSATVWPQFFVERDVASSWANSLFVFCTLLWCSSCTLLHIKQVQCTNQDKNFFQAGDGNKNEQHVGGCGDEVQSSNTIPVAVDPTKLCNHSEQPCSHLTPGLKQHYTFWYVRTRDSDFTSNLSKAHETRDSL